MHGILASTCGKGKFVETQSAKLRAAHLRAKVYSYILSRTPAHSGEHVCWDLAVTIAKRLVDWAVCQVSLGAPCRGVMVQT